MSGRALSALLNDGQLPGNQKSGVVRVVIRWPGDQTGMRHTANHATAPCHVPATAPVQ